MAYTKTLWQDRVVATPNKYTKLGETSTEVTLVAAPGTVTQAGTPITAGVMNKIEQGIVDAYAVADIVDSKLNVVFDNNLVFPGSLGTYYKQELSVEIGEYTYHVVGATGATVNMYRYDQANKTFLTLATVGSPNAVMAAANICTDGTSIYALFTVSGGANSYYILKYNIALNSWSTLSARTTGVVAYNIFSGIAISSDGYIYNITSDQSNVTNPLYIHRTDKVTGAATTTASTKSVSNTRVNNNMSPVIYGTDLFVATETVGTFYRISLSNLSSAVGFTVAGLLGLSLYNTSNNGIMTVADDKVFKLALAGNVFVIGKVYSLFYLEATLSPVFSSYLGQFSDRNKKINAISELKGF